MIYLWREICKHVIKLDFMDAWNLDPIQSRFREKKSFYRTCYPNAPDNIAKTYIFCSDHAHPESQDITFVSYTVLYLWLRQNIVTKMGSQITGWALGRRPEPGPCSMRMRCATRKREGFKINPCSQKTVVENLRNFRLENQLRRRIFAKR